MLADYHVHSEFSDDSVYPMEQVVKDAIAMGSMKSVLQTMWTMESRMTGTAVIQLSIVARNR